MKRLDAALSAADRERLAAVERLAGDPEAVPALVGHLEDPSWPVRRAVVQALAGLGDAAVGPLVATLVSDRSVERRIAATVDALSASSGDPDPALLALGAADPAVLCDAAQILGRRRSRRALDTLVRWVGHPDDNVAVGAMEAIGRIDGGAGLDALAAAAGSGNPFRTFAAIEVLSRVEEPGALAPLERLVFDPVAGAEATRALGRRAVPDAIPRLAELLDARPAARARAAATALTAIAARQEERFGASAGVAHEVRAAVPDAAETSRRLAQAAIDGDAEERAAVARVLGWLGDPGGMLFLLGAEPALARAASSMVGALDDEAVRDVLAAVPPEDSETRAVILRSLRPGPGVAAAVVSCLEDPDPEIRRLACDLLARSQATDAVPALFRALDDEDPRVGQAATAALQALGHDRTEELALAAARSPSPRVRRAALRLVGYFGWPSALDVVVEAIASDDARLAETALHSLAFVEDPRAVPLLLAHAADPRAPRRAAALRALGHTRATPEVVDRIAAAIEDPDAWVRYYACQAVGRLRVVALVGALVGRLEDPAGHVRIAVIDALARIPEPVAVRALLDAAGSEEPELRRAALLGLGMASPPEGLAPVLAATRGDDATTRLIAFSALAGFDGPEVVEALAAAARDPDPAVSATAVGVLGGRAGVAATDALLGLLDTPARESAFGALTTWARGRVPALLAAAEREGSTADDAISTLARMTHPSAHAALGVALAMDPTAIRRAAAAALAAVGAGSCRAGLELAATSDADAEVRRWARHALARP